MKISRILFYKEENRSIGCLNCEVCLCAIFELLFKQLHKSSQKHINSYKPMNSIKQYISEI